MNEAVPNKYSGRLANETGGRLIGCLFRFLSCICLHYLCYISMKAACAVLKYYDDDDDDQVKSNVFLKHI